jgi:hypothetical protein
MSSLKILLSLLSFLLIACYPIKESVTGPGTGSCLITVGEHKYSGYTFYSKSLVSDILFDVIEIQLDTNKTLRILHKDLHAGKFNHHRDTREFAVLLDYDDPSASYVIDRGTLRIDSFTDDHVQGALDVYMMPLSGGNWVDWYNLLQVSGEFYALRE